MTLYPSTPRWNIERPFLTGRFQQETKATSCFAESLSSSGAEKAIGCYDAGVQELIVIDDLLSALVGIEGRYISIKRRVNHVHGSDTYDFVVTFQVDASMDLVLQEMAKRIFPLCESFVLIEQFVESRSQFKNGLVNHAFAATLRAFLLDYEAMVAQLEHQFRLGRLSIQGLWFYCQPMMGSMQALSTVIHKASANNSTGSAVLNRYKYVYFRHASGEMYVISQALAKFISINRLSDLEKHTESGSILHVHIGDVFSPSESAFGRYAGEFPCDFKMSWRIVIDLFSEGKVLAELEEVEIWLKLEDRLMPNGRFMVNCGGINGVSDMRHGTTQPKSLNDVWMHNSAIRAFSKAFPGQLCSTAKMEGSSQFDLIGTGKLEENARKKWWKLSCTYGPSADLSLWSAAVPGDLSETVKKWMSCSPFP